MIFCGHIYFFIIFSLSNEDINRYDMKNVRFEKMMKKMEMF